MKRALLSLLVLLVALPSAFADSSHGVVLMYHRFEENRYPSTNIRMEQFTRQLDYLKREGFTVWPLRKLIKAMQAGETVPDRTVALTVDDAYLSFYQHAYPVLKQRGLPLTVFVSTDAVDKHQSGYMSWAQMRDMQGNGIDYANHSAAHLHLIHRLEGESCSAWQKRIKGDIDRAQQRLDSELGEQGYKLFAYPFGEYNSKVADLVKSMGYIAFGQQSGSINAMSDKRALPRFPINEHYAALDTFGIKVQSLPMPLKSQSPWEPELDRKNPPTLKLEFREDMTSLAPQVRCYLGSGKSLDVKVENGNTLIIQAQRPLRQGRSRYNCTAPAGAHRYYWLSQPWFNGPDPADPGY